MVEAPLKTSVLNRPFILKLSTLYFVLCAGSFGSRTFVLRQHFMSFSTLGF